METSKVRDPLVRLLRTSIQTAERLDVLMYVCTLRGASVGARAVAHACRISTQSAEHHLAALCGRGFLKVTIGTELVYGFHPVSVGIRTMVAELEQLLVLERTSVLAVLGSATDGDGGFLLTDGVANGRKNDGGRLA